MRRNRPILGGSLLLALLIGGAGTVQAEVHCQGLDDLEEIECLYLLIAGITEEPDPLTLPPDGPQAVGEGVLPSEGVENPAPQVATGGGLTVAVWMETGDGDGGDIMFSEWRPGGWQSLALTVGGFDERDPRVDVADDGTVYVTWWETEEPRQIRVARRDPVTQQWSHPSEFSRMFGSRPTVLALDSEVIVAYERRIWSGGQEVVVHSSGVGHSAADAFVLARTSREAPLAIELHPHGTRPYIDWIHSTGYFGYSEYVDGQWGASLSVRPLTQRASTGRRDILPLMH